MGETAERRRTWALGAIWLANEARWDWRRLTSSGVATPMADPPPRHETIDVGGVRLHTVSVGQGPLVVLLHGFPDLWSSWRHQIGPLASRFRLALTEGLDRWVPDVRVRRIPRCGHWVHQEAPDEVNAAILEFLSSGREGRPGTAPRASASSG